MTPSGSSVKLELRKHCLKWMNVEDMDSSDGVKAIKYCKSLMKAAKLLRGSHRDNGVVELFTPQVRNALENVAPTSVTSERLFSRARHIRPYCRARLADDTFQNLILLKNYFKFNVPKIA